MSNLKFRCFDPSTKRMFFPAVIDGETGSVYETGRDYENGIDCNECPIMQFTGFKDKNGKDVFEGDIFRIEEEDMIFYIIVVWIHEWAMFSTLRCEDEYQAYLMDGVDGIDETMFWTYTLEDIDSPKHYPAGNIHQNPELLVYEQKL